MPRRTADQTPGQGNLTTLTPTLGGLVPALQRAGRGEPAPFPDPHVPDAGARLVQALLRLPDSYVLDLPEVLPTAAAQPWAQEWPGRVSGAAGSLNLQSPALPVADVLARVPTKTAGTLNRKLRRIDQLGVERTEVAPGDVPRAVSRGSLAIARRMLQGRARDLARAVMHGLRMRRAHR